MERLILLRHGKAEPGAPSGEDFDRALTERGRRDAALVAGALARAGFGPDIALVSPAARARATWEAMAPWFPLAKLILVPALYNAGPETLLAEAETKSAGRKAVMVVAHNPGLHQLCFTLAQSAKDAEERGRLNGGFPTGAAAAFEFHTGRFKYFTPKSLGGGA